jgi:hypothetical protein
MPTVKISELPAGTAAATAIVPATNAAGTTTEKVTCQSIANLAPVTSVAGRTGAITLAVADVANAVSTSDSRLTDTRVPTDGSVTSAKIDAGGLSVGSINWAAVTAWAASTAYAKGQAVHYLGITYRRTSAGTSGSTFDSGNWQQMTAPVNVTVTPTQLAANTNDYALAIATADIFRISSSAAVNITGITAGLFDGHAILLRNVGSFNITLKHQDGSSTAANRIISPWAGDVVIAANSSMLLMYDASLASARWVVT